MPSTSTVSRGTALYNTQDNRIRDVSKAIADLEPDEGPITTLLAHPKMGAKVQVFNAKVEHGEDELLPEFTTLTADATASATTLTVANPTYLRAGDLLKINNAEICRVDTTPTANPVTVTRGTGVTPGTAASSGQQVFIYSHSEAEGSAQRDLLSTQITMPFNYLQFMSEPFSLTWTAQQSQTYGGDDWARQKKKALLQIKRKMNNAMIHGEPGQATVSSQYRHQTGGCLYYMNANISDAGGDLTELEFDEWIRLFTQFGSNKDKIVYCGTKAASVISGFARDRLRTRVEDQKYGVTISSYESAGEMVRIVKDKHLRNDSITDVTGFAGYALGLDLSNIELCHLGPNLVYYRENVETPGTHGRQYEYFTQMGIRFKLPKTHALLRGITG